MRLHLGCGGDLKPGYVNIDIQEPFDVQHDFRTPLPYEDNSIDEIYSHDVIQHFSRAEWKFIKKDWVRVLKLGGKMQLLCHDFEYVLNNFSANANGEKWGYWLQCIYAGQANEFDYFKNAFTYDKLTGDLREEGMGQFEHQVNDQSFINLICYKP